MAIHKAGALYTGNNNCSFKVWAPEKEKVTLQLFQPQVRLLDMKKDAWGYFKLEAGEVKPGDEYFFIPEGGKGLPDPASHYQAKGVHGPSVVVDHNAFEWTDGSWKGIPFKNLILYEIHVGTFTKEGTFSAIIPMLDDLVETGFNAIEIMPVSQFPGNRNWGYDGVFPYAVQNSYGGPDALKALIDACHSKGIAVFLDVVYNHLGPEGNYLPSFGPYFTDKYDTPWGDAINFDGEWSDGVREYFSNNTLHWFENFHFDGLRLDAIHTIFDIGAVHFWEMTYHKIKELEQKMGRFFCMIAESDLNSPRVVKNPEVGGFGFDAMWLDDFHHSLYVILHEEGKDRYTDFGSLYQLAKAYTEGFVHSGELVNLRKRKYGASSAGMPGQHFIVFNQNHDQVGNRVQGERLSMLVEFEKLKIASAAILLSPYIPMFFMGEEYGDDSPYFYFVSHTDEELIAAVREGRKVEFKNFNWTTEPPDPQGEETFSRSKLQWHKRNLGHHGLLLKWNKTLIGLRRHHPALQSFNKNNLRVDVIENRGIALLRKSDDETRQLLCLFNLSAQPINYTFCNSSPSWKKMVDAKDDEWMEKEKPFMGNHLPQNVAGDEKVLLEPWNIAIYEPSQLTIN